MATAIQFLRSSTTSLRPDPVSLEDGMPMLNYGAVEPGLFFALEDDSLMKIGPTHVGDTAPNAGPQGFIGNAKGEQWLDTTGGSNTIKIYDGTQWLTSSFSLSGDSLITDGNGVRLNENSQDFATFPRNETGDGYNLIGNIGFGTSLPTHKVSVDGGLRLYDQTSYPAGNLGALAVVAGSFLFHNGAAWTVVNTTPNLWEQVGNDAFYDQGDVLIGAGSPGSPAITLTSTGAGAFDGGGSFGNDVTVGGDGLTTVGVIAHSNGHVSMNKADGTVCLELRENGTVNTSMTAAGSATFAGEVAKDTYNSSSASGYGWSLSNGADFGQLEVQNASTSTAGDSAISVRRGTSISARINADGSATFAGELETTTAGDGVILASPDGTRYRVTVTNAGVLDVATA